MNELNNEELIYLSTSNLSIVAADLLSDLSINTLSLDTSNLVFNAQGKDGVGILSIQQVEFAEGNGEVNVIKCVLTDGTETEFYIKNGSGFTQELLDEFELFKKDIFDEFNENKIELKRECNDYTDGSIANATLTILADTDKALIALNTKFESEVGDVSKALLELESNAEKARAELKTSFETELGVVSKSVLTLESSTNDAIALLSTDFTTSLGEVAESVVKLSSDSETAMIELSTLFTSQLDNVSKSVLQLEADSNGAISQLRTDFNTGLETVSNSVLELAATSEDAIVSLKTEFTTSLDNVALSVLDLETSQGGAISNLLTSIQTALSSITTALQLIANADNAILTLLTSYETTQATANSAIEQIADTNLALQTLQTSYEGYVEDTNSIIDTLATISQLTDLTGSFTTFKNAYVKDNEILSQAIREANATATGAILKFETYFNTNGELINKTGLVTTSDGNNSFTKLYSAAIANDGTIVKEASFSTRVETIAGTVVSNATISADLIDVTGSTTFKDSVDSWITAIYNNNFENLQNAYQGIADSIKNDLLNQIDGAIETWYFEGVPGPTKTPESTWLNPDVRNKHLGDLYYDKKTGYAYRYLLNNSTYTWVRIQDTDITEALGKAAAAQSTADGKMKVFGTQPTPPYQIGDLWVNAPQNGSTSTVIKTCINAKTTGQTFALADWIVASDYQTSEDVKKQILSDLKDYKTYAETLAKLGYTEISGGLIFSNTLELRDYAINPKDGVVTAGINGITNSNAPGKGIAAWFGGSMIDKQITGNQSNTSAAKNLFRFDGSGYLSNGGIYWDADGSLFLANSLHLGDTGDKTIGNIVSSVENLTILINALSNIIEPVDSNGNIVYRSDDKIDFDNTTGNVIGYKIGNGKGIYSESFVSALGKSGNTVDVTAGVKYLYALEDVNISSPKSGSALIFNATSNKWEAKLLDFGKGDVESVAGLNGIITIEQLELVLNLQSLAHSNIYYDETAQTIVITGEHVDSPIQSVALLSQLADVQIDSSNLTSGNVLVYNGNRWVAGKAGLDSDAINSILNNYLLKSNFNKTNILSTLALTANDIPNLPTSKITSGIFSFDRLPTMYWADVLVSKTSNKETTPTVKTITVDKVALSCDTDALKINANMFSTGNISALGKASSTVTVNANLLGGHSIDLTSLEPNQTLVYDGNKWINKVASASGGVSSFNDLLDKPTTIAGYDITDAKIENGKIILGANNITPLTSASTLNATKLSGTIPTSCYTNTTYDNIAALLNGTTVSLVTTGEKYIWNNKQNALTTGSVSNDKLANSSITIAGQSVSLGGSITAKTIGAALTTTAPAAYATSAGSAAKLTTVSKTAWGLTYWTSGGVPTNISGNMTGVGSITMSGGLSGATTGSFSSDVTVGGNLVANNAVTALGKFDSTASINANLLGSHNISVNSLKTNQILIFNGTEWINKDANTTDSRNADTIDGYHIVVTADAGSDANTIYFVI